MHLDSLYNGITIENLDTNEGPGAARNKGLAVSQGEYIVFLDGDDLLTSNALARLSELVRTHHYDLITFNWTCFSDIEEGGVIVPRRRDLNEMPTERDAIISHYLSMNMDGSVIYTMAKKSLLLAVMIINSMQLMMMVAYDLAF